MYSIRISTPIWTAHCTWCGELAHGHMVGLVGVGQARILAREGWVDKGIWTLWFCSSRARTSIQNSTLRYVWARIHVYNLPVAPPGKNPNTMALEVGKVQHLRARWLPSTSGRAKRRREFEAQRSPKRKTIGTYHLSVPHWLGGIWGIWVSYYDLLRGATFRSDGVRRVLRVAFCHHALRPPKMILLLAMLKCQSSKGLSVQSSMLSNWLANHGHCIFFWCGWSKYRAASIFALDPRFFPRLGLFDFEGVPGDWFGCRPYGKGVLAYSDGFSCDYTERE